eukprot:SAG11_NODE_31499_length_291_cov_0.989583_1_plen_23_part_10
MPTEGCTLKDKKKKASGTSLVEA